MIVQRCVLTLHDLLFYATREMGRLYETGKYLHNYGLTYALGLARAPYAHRGQVPAYDRQLTPLNHQAVYVTPARPLHYDFQFHTFKRAQVTYYSFQGQSTVNMPIYGRAKELAPGSTFEFFVFSRTPLALPHWVRLGKWMSKAEIRLVWQGEPATRSGDFICAHPLNPLDLPHPPLAFDLISMPPVSLVQNAHLAGEYYCLPDGTSLPKGLCYTFPGGLS